MKRYIIILVMLVIALGLNAQRTNTGTRSTSKSASTKASTEEEKKSSPEKVETRKTGSSTVRPNTNTDNQTKTPARTAPVEKRAEPGYNESRNRETPPVKRIENPRRVESSPSDNRSSTPNTTPQVSPTRKTQERPARVSNSGTQEPERKTGVSNSGTRETGDRNTGVSRQEGGTRTHANTRGTQVDRNRKYTPRTEQVYVEKRQAYRTPERHRSVRTVNQSSTYVHQPIEYRRSYYPYAEPRRIDIIWDVHMYNEYRYIYPQYDYWYYPYGYSIHTISAYDADRYIGEIARIYGRVSDVYYERQTDEYTLYFGEPYPYHDFSVILSGKHARRYSRHPERYFTNRNITVTGLVSLWDERPEMIIKKRSQIEIYY